MNIKICEMFHSIQGESTASGFPSFFVRFAGCNLNCRYCDSVYARSGGQNIDIERIVSAVSDYKGLNHITITGGEPLIQPGAVPLIRALRARGHKVQVETNGSLLIDEIPCGTKIIADIKAPSSGEEGSFLLENIGHMREHDEYKIVISDENDFRFAVDFVKKHISPEKQTINISPAEGRISAEETADLILRSGLPLRLNVQLHKLVFAEIEKKRRGI